MSKDDVEIKPVEGFDLGEDWLDSLDLGTLTQEALAWEAGDADDDLVEVEGVAQDLVLIRALDVKAEQRRVMNDKPVGGLVGDLRGHVKHYLILVLLRLFDDLELIFLQAHINECLDLAKQISRLGNILCFCSLSDQLPVLAYVYNLLPVVHESCPIGQMASLVYAPEREPSFTQKQGEILHCFNYLLGFIRGRFGGLDTERYAQSLGRVYEKLQISAAPPSPEAPLPVADSVNPRELTSRTINKLARTLDGLITEAIHYIESTALYGYSTGYREAGQCFQDAAQLAHEFKLENLVEDFSTLAAEIAKLSPKDKPSQDIYPLFEGVFVKVKKHFPHLLLEKKLRHLFGIIAKFSLGADADKVDTSFEARWKRFLVEVTPILNQVLNANSNDDNALIRLYSASIKYDLKWLTTIFATFNKHWRAFPDSCMEAFLILAQDILAFPTENIDEGDLKSLTNEKLRILFERKSNLRNVTPYTLVESASRFLGELAQSGADPQKIPRERLQNLILDARSVKSHAILRSCECLEEILDSANKQQEQEANLCDDLVDALFFCTELLRNSIQVTRELCEGGDADKHLDKPKFFFQTLLKMYSPEGMASDPIVLFVTKLVSDTIAQLQLVWANTATPTPTDYYCSLLAELLHIANLMELDALREKALAHLSDIPAQDFINTANASLYRQTQQLMRLAERSLPAVHTPKLDENVSLFFARTAASCAFYASSSDNSAGLSQGLKRLENAIFPIAKESHFVPCIAIAFELRNLARTQNLSHEDINNFLYWLLRVAHNVCPNWTQSDMQGLEDLNIALSIPITTYLRHFRAVERLRAELADKADQLPAAWDALNMLQQASLIFSSPQAMLAQLGINVKSRCAYLKKTIDFTTHYTQSADKEEKFSGSQLVTFHAFFHCIEKLVELLIHFAFHSNNISSFIEIHLSSQKNAVSASISHNGVNFTLEELTSILGKFKLIPAPDDDLLDLLSQIKRIQRIYPPVSHIAYILPIIRQFNGKNDLNTIDGVTYIRLQFPVS